MYASDEFKNNPLLLRVLSYTNAEVASINAKMRKAMFGDGAKDFEEGDIVMVT